MVNRKTASRRTTFVTGLRRKLAGKLETLADAARNAVARAESGVTEAAEKAEVKVKAATRRAETGLAKIRKSAKKEVVGARKAVKAKAAAVETTAKRKIAQAKRAVAPAK